LREFVDSGGNGDVWIVDGSEGRVGALKILHKFGGDGYPRFIREVKTVRGLDSDRYAVLPILDAHVPESPSETDPPWFVMPVATGMWKALIGQPAAAKVAAIRDLAKTLAALVEDEELNHRDLKPPNLYLDGARFVVGDFGLAKRPDDEDLTAEGKVVGPFLDLPSEVFIAGGDVDWERVDVNVLARVLWQLIAEADMPVRGPITVGGEYSLTRFSNDQYLSRLDGPLAAATHETPASRPTMAEFEAGLSD
jgi:hypothetical protein